MSSAFLLNPTNSLKEKVGSGGLPPEIIEYAIRTVDDFCQNVDFQSETRSVLINIAGHMRQAEQYPENCADPLVAIFDIAHDLRGQAATFEFPMVTRIAASLCRFTVSRSQMSSLELRITRVHVDAMMRVIRDNTRGNTDRLAQQVISGLEYLVRRREQKYVSSPIS